MVFLDMFDPGSLRAALFDLDGTLIETHIDFPAMTRAMLELAQDAGLTREDLLHRDILGIVDHAVDLLHDQGKNAGAFRIKAFGVLESMEIAGCAEPILLPGTRECLMSLRASGIKIGIVTRNCRAVSAKMLTDYALPYDVLLTRDDVARTKPNPEHLWDALTMLNQSAPQSVMVGDHWMDIQAGNAAGCAATVGVLGKNQPAHFEPCPPNDFVRDLSELTAVVNARAEAL